MEQDACPEESFLKVIYERRATLGSNLSTEYSPPYMLPENFSGLS